MKFKEFKIVQVDLNYLQALHEVDSEVMYRRFPLQSKLLKIRKRMAVVILFSLRGKYNV